MKPRLSRADAMSNKLTERRAKKRPSTPRIGSASFQKAFDEGYANFFRSRNLAVPEKLTAGTNYGRKTKEP